MADTPIVVIQGPRQCGKTTLARQVPGTFLSLDDDVALEQATLNPAGFVKGHPGCLIIDEAQRAPKIFLAIKAEVDRYRRPGMYLITGSTDILLLPKIADSLAGRHEVISLWPLSVGEVEGASENFIDWAFSEDFTWKGADQAWSSDLLARGGYPEAVSRTSEPRRAKWFDQYIEALITKDVRYLANIQNIALIPRLLRALAKQTGYGVNVNTLAAETGLQRTTAERYLDLLEAVFLYKPIETWQPEDGTRVARKPKVAFVDSGILNSIWPEIGLEQALDSFVTMEMVKASGWAHQSISVKTFRSTQAWSIPVILENSRGKIVAITISAGLAPAREAAARMQFLRELAGDRYHRGVVLHLGTESQRIGDRVGSMPISSLWAKNGT